mmetsp:Transcript_72727/g.117245  ORF Transcript_72727/g.117245 Transcript_72727/m.117245 type:complete len:93 (-) Transcript_72727:57-335(-)
MLHLSPGLSEAVDARPSESCTTSKHALQASSSVASSEVSTSDPAAALPALEALAFDFDVCVDCRALPLQSARAARQPAVQRKPDDFKLCSRK